MSSKANFNKINRLRERRIKAMGDPGRCSGGDISMDSFEDLMLNLLTFLADGSDADSIDSSDADSIDSGDAAVNNGIMKLHHGVVGEAVEAGDAEAALLCLLQAYHLLYESMQEEEFKDSLTTRIRKLLGKDSNGNDFKFELNFKKPDTMMVKTLLRRKRLNDAIRTTVVCTPEEEAGIRRRLTNKYNDMLKQNGFLSLKDDLYSKKAWPVLKILIPAVRYLYFDEEQRKEDEWTRMAFGVEIQVTGPRFMQCKENMHDEYEAMRTEKATRDFLDHRPFQMGNLEILVAFCHCLSKTGNKNEYVHLSKIHNMVQKREHLCKKQGVDLRFEVLYRKEVIQYHMRRFQEVAERDDCEGLLHFDHVDVGESDSDSDSSDGSESTYSSGYDSTSSEEEFEDSDDEGSY